ncbi:MAG: hypothetical protein Q7U10_05450 [Thermodesulfovibrionia bacterium]|nr:hypothetical protein [Thermodesulfovibrionia bacterium]
MLRFKADFLAVILLAAISLIGAKAEAAPFAYITNASGFSNNVSVIDTAINTVVATVAVGTSPVGVSVNPTGTRVYVTNVGSNNVYVIDTATNAVVATVPVGTNPYGVSVNPAGTRVYVANLFSNNVYVIDTATNAVVATVAVGTSPPGVSVDPTGTRVYVTNSESANVSVIDTATNTVVATVPVGIGPFGVSVNPAGTRAYVANQSSNNVSVIDTATNTVVATVPVGIGPSALGQFIGPEQYESFILTITGSGNGSGTVSETGIDCTITNGTSGGDCSEVYDDGTVVSLTPSADAGYTFTGWSGDCDADGQVTMDADKTCTATFTCSDPYEIINDLYDSVNTEVALRSIRIRLKGTLDSCFNRMPAAIDGDIRSLNYAVRYIEQFKMYVNKYIKTGEINGETGDGLLQRADDLIASFTCEETPEP